jgi:hypothetical protein
MRLRSPDAAQRAAFAAWCAADPGSTGIVIGPGSAKQRFALRRVRDTRASKYSINTDAIYEMASRLDAR